MSDEMMNASGMIIDAKLDIVETIKEGISIGIKNAAAILVNVVLWVVTLWIPYLNVGTTIGLFVGIVSKASKGEGISSTEIFNPVYRKYIGEYFLTAGLMYMGIAVGVVFMIIPGIVISLAWCFALLLVIDKHKNPTEALALSNQCTYGFKWKIFAIYMIVSIAVSIVNVLLSGIVGSFSSGLAVCILIIMLIISIFIMIGVQASMYKQLTADV